MNLHFSLFSSSYEKTHLFEKTLSMNTSRKLRSNVAFMHPLLCMQQLCLWQLPLPSHHHFTQIMHKNFTVYLGIAKRSISFQDVIFVYLQFSLRLWYTWQMVLQGYRLELLDCWTLHLNALLTLVVYLSI